VHDTNQVIQLSPAIRTTTLFTRQIGRGSPDRSLCLCAPGEVQQLPAQPEAALGRRLGLVKARPLPLNTVVVPAGLQHSWINQF
jgi:hypothetical protein